MGKLIAPATVTSYFDRVQFWLPDDIDPRLEDLLRRECGKGGFFKKLGSARFNARLRCRIDLKQPSERAVSEVSHLQQAFINSLEVALDFNFPTSSARDAAHEFVHHHLVRRWHSRRQEIRFFSSKEKGGQSLDEGGPPSGTRYDAPRSAPNLLVLYTEAFCRITGELFCLHLEWRAKGAAAVRRAGVTCAADLVRFNHRAFWEKRLLFRNINPDRLGLLLSNQKAGGKRRNAVRHDRRIGSIIMNSRTTIQEVIDEWGSSVRINRALIPISNADWLPATSNSLFVIYPKEPPTRRGEPEPSIPSVPELEQEAG